MTESTIALYRQESTEARVRSLCVRGVESKCPRPSDCLLSQEAASQARLRVFLYILSTFLYILISLTHELWRWVK